MYEFSDQEVAAFKSLLPNNWYYRVRIRDSNSNGDWMISSMPACSLLGNKYRDSFHFYIDKMGGISGFDYAQPSGNVNCDPALVVDNQIKLLSRLKVSLPADAQEVSLNAVPNPHLDGTGGTGAPRRASSEAGKSGDTSDDPDEQAKPTGQSFLRKYWYLLVPIALISFLSPGPNPNADAEPARSGKGEKQK